MYLRKRLNIYLFRLLHLIELGILLWNAKFFNAVHRFHVHYLLKYRSLHGLGPDYLPSDFTRVSNLWQRQRLRSASTAALVLPATRHSTLGDRAFPVIGARLWNSLPDDITTATSLLTFRHKLKTFLFRRSYDTRLQIICFFGFYFLVFLCF